MANTSSTKKELKYLKNLPHIKSHLRVQAIKEINIKSKVGCIYFIREEGDMEYFKIGFTYHLPTRLKQLQCANRRKLVVHKKFLCLYPEQEEARLHEKYADNRVRGEWFRIKL